MADKYAGVPIWRRVIAAVLDFFTAFFVFGFLVARLAGGMTEDGFSLKGASAFVLFGLVILYFVVGRFFLGGTPWQYVLSARRRRALV